MRLLPAPKAGAAYIGAVKLSERKEGRKNEQAEKPKRHKQLTSDDCSILFSCLPYVDIIYIYYEVVSSGEYTTLYNPCKL